MYLKMNRIRKETIRETSCFNKVPASHLPVHSRIALHLPGTRFHRPATGRETRAGHADSSPCPDETHRQTVPVNN